VKILVCKIVSSCHGFVAFLKTRDIFVANPCTSTYNVI